MLLYKYGLECTHITQLTSDLSTAYTLANVLSVKPRKTRLILASNHKPEELEKFNNYCRYEAVNTVFYHMDGLQCPNESTDMVVMDTSEYLERWSKVAKKYIVIMGKGLIKKYPTWKLEEENQGITVLKKMKSVEQ